MESKKNTYLCNRKTINDTMIGRKRELAELQKYYDSGKPEFVALYGRRRVGKTFLIEQFFANKYSFKVSGVVEGDAEVQYSAFNIAMREYGYEGRFSTDWMLIFNQLGKMLDKKIRKKRRCVIFVDELPCFDTPKSKFVKALGHFWNTWCSTHNEVMLVVCGSATSWMVKNIIDNHGGLHNRITHEMHIHPFTLNETEQMLKSQGVQWDRLAIAQMYMAIGGVPYYISLVERGESVAQALDRMFFGEEAVLRNEYERLFSSLFKEPAPYIAILDFLSTCKEGVSRERIAEAIKKQDGGHLTEYLNNLQRCDFVRYYSVKGRNGLRKTGGLYQITDFFIVFHNTFLKNRTTNASYWSQHLNTPKINTWNGLAFERLCMAHITQIKHALGIDRIATEYFSWRSKQSEEGAQIDLVIERADRVTNVCEIKYSEGDYRIDKAEERSIRNRCEDFRNETKTRNSVVTTLVTTFGMRANEYSSAINAVVTLDELFL